MSFRFICTSPKLLLLVAGCCLRVLAQSDLPAMPPASQVKVDFARDIEPIFKSRCVGCHNAKLQSGGFRLDNRAGALAGGYSGIALLPGRSAESRLIRLVAGLEKDVIMPMGGSRLPPNRSACFAPGSTRVRPGRKSPAHRKMQSISLPLEIYLGRFAAHPARRFRSRKTRSGSEILSMHLFCRGLRPRRSSLRRKPAEQR